MCSYFVRCSCRYDSAGLITGSSWTRREARSSCRTESLTGRKFCCAWRLWRAGVTSDLWAERRCYNISVDRITSVMSARRWSISRHTDAVDAHRGLTLNSANFLVVDPTFVVAVTSTLQLLNLAVRMTLPSDCRAVTPSYLLTFEMLLYKICMMGLNFTTTEKCNLWNISKIFLR